MTMDLDTPTILTGLAIIATLFVFRGVIKAVIILGLVVALALLLTGVIG